MFLLWIVPALCQFNSISSARLVNRLVNRPVNRPSRSINYDRTEANVVKILTLTLSPTQIFRGFLDGGFISIYLSIYLSIFHDTVWTTNH